MNRIKYLRIAAAAAVIILCGCGGGFGTDSNEASDLGPGIFGTDSTRRTW
ncbi:MAG: hypothetical protein LBB56_05235 [Chitinispirillales bacterium]|nr:hypothetical protein [Chitinispirillales bacterium]